MVSLSEVSRQIGLSRQRVSQMVADRELPVRVAGNQVLIERELLHEFQRRPAARPLSARNAWALLAILSNSRPDFVSRFQLSKLRKLATQREKLLGLLRYSQPRSRVHRLELFPAQIPQIGPLLQRKTGLAAELPDLHLVKSQETVDAYVSQVELEEIRERFRPTEGGAGANLILRVPTDDWVLRNGVVPIVIAADLLNDRDPRVVRAAESLF